MEIEERALGHHNPVIYEYNPNLILVCLLAAAGRTIWFKASKIEGIRLSTQFHRIPME
jgi:hypothetical protein